MQNIMDFFSGSQMIDHTHHVVKKKLESFYANFPSLLEQMNPIFPRAIMNDVMSFFVIPFKHSSTSPP